MSADPGSVRDRIAQNDVTMARSYLEVDFMEWFSENEIPFGYEAFTIPSVVGPGQDEWSAMVQAIRAVGERDFEGYDRLVNGTRWEDTRPAEVLAMWEDIYDKHRLQEEQVTVEVRRSMSEFDKQLILPDFALYPNFEGTIAPESFDWSSWDYIVEVSGLWGVGLPGEATESDWWDWYRVSAVAFKEFVYRMLGLWDDVVWAVPNQAFVEGVTDGIPQALRNDPHYVIFNTTSAEPDLGRLYDAVGGTGRDVTRMDARLSEPIELVEYRRPLEGGDEGDIQPTRWDYDSVVLGNVNRNEKTAIVENGFVVYFGELGEVYVSDDSVHVREAQWRGENMIVLREYALDAVSKLADDGIVVGLVES